MSLERIGLGKLLILIQASAAQRTSLLRTDIRNDIRNDAQRAAGEARASGGDFYVPFWADAKRHVAGELDLGEAAEARVARNDRRARLYPELCEGFLLWWDGRRRTTNAPVILHEDHVKARYEAPGLGTVKVENTLSITVAAEGRQVIYPYFCEDPELTEAAARLGLWVMSACVAGYSLEQMRILDVIAGKMYSGRDATLTGREERLFLSQYASVLDERRRLRAEYD